MTRPHQAALFCFVWAAGTALTAPDSVALASEAKDAYHPRRRVPPSLESILRHVTPGGDEFPEEKEARELAAALEELSALLREGRTREAPDRLLAPDFQGGPLTTVDEASLGGSPHLQVFRAQAFPPGLGRDRSSFLPELLALVGDLTTVRVAEFLITAIGVKPEEGPIVRTEVRYDIVGDAKSGGRAQRSGRWQMRWRRGGDGAWRVVEWTALSGLRSQASAPVFREVTAAALGGNASFRRQLGPGLDAWLSILDSAFSADTMGLHGVSVGDADGDGRDDIYVAQPAGLPNRLFRNRGDGVFEDVTDAAGLAVLDSTSQSIFADLDNDGDQDVVLVTRTGLLLMKNDGTGRFAHDPGAFPFKGGLRGSPTAVSLADYDRDGFLDVYLCTYSYFIGASEDKSGPGTPYHDAQNGPPNVLLRNDGHGRFLDVTEETGLHEHNDRFSLAAAWADYDEDGWPDLLVANDFGRKNLYRNLGTVNGRVRFKDVAAEAGVEDHGAGMSATFLDYDHDGHLDIYTGNMWTAAGQRVTSAPGFMPGVSEEVRALYRRHARGNSLFRNRGDGTFEDVTLAAHAEMGRWAWSSDALDFDLDGWEDLYVVNGMFTREGSEEEDLDSFFWRQVVARSPLAFRSGTSFDDGWRAINRLLVTSGSQASHERKVFLRNNGRGGFDEVGGSVGLDLDQDGRSFAVTDHDGDGDPDLVVYAPRSSPQLRIFRNDFLETNAALALRLRGTRSNRDGVGARVTVETEASRLTRIVQAGSGFLSQHSKELLFGLGRSRRIAKVTILWPSGLVQTLADLPADHRIYVEEGNDRVRAEPLGRRLSAPAPAVDPTIASVVQPPSASWLFEPFPAPEFTPRDPGGEALSLTARRGRSVLVFFGETSASPSATALQTLAEQRESLARAGVEVLALSPAGEIADTYTILNRYLFARKEDLRLPSAFLVNPKGEVVKVYRGGIVVGELEDDVGRIDAPAPDRLARAVPFAGRFYVAPGPRSYFQYALELAEQGFEALSLVAFERAARADPSAITFYNLGTLSMKGGRPAEAGVAFRRALELKPGYAEASNSLGALLAQSGDLPGAIARFRSALEAKPDFPDALNNLGYALFQTGREQEARDLYLKALALQPDFPEAFNNLGIFYGQQGELDRAESYFRQALEKRAGYGEAANNLALVLAATGDAPGAILSLQHLLEQDPGFEMGYVTLARIYLSAGRRREGIQVLELLLQRNPKNPIAPQILREIKGGG